MKNNIITYYDLNDLVESDSENTGIRHSAELFLSAMLDWPTFNLENISQFITELENYFGKPLTREQIAAKKLEYDDVSVWRNESGYAISEMISIAETSMKETNFEKIVTMILSHYESKLN